MPKDWTPEDLVVMDDETLRRFYENVRGVAAGNNKKLINTAIALLPLIEIELERRNADRVAAYSSPARAPKFSR